MSRVALDRVSKTFRDQRRAVVQAVRQLSLEVQPGECMVLLGPSGCGKTTTLRLIAGLEEPDTGTISLADRDLAGVPPQDRDVAMVFQHYSLFPHLSVADNLTLGLKLRQLPSAETAARLSTLAEALGLTPLLDRLPKELSGGERQRVAIGRAIIRRPRVLLFDEPLSNLDVPLRAQLRAEITAQHRRTGATVLYVTHDQAEAMALAGRIAVLAEGAVQQCADPQTIYRRPANVMVAGFVGAPPMNFVRGMLRRDGTGMSFQPAGGPAWRLPTSTASRFQARAEGELLLGLRPEQLHLAAEGEVRGVVTAVEQLGSETVVKVSADGCLMAMRLPPGPTPALEESVVLRVDWEGACFFDPKTGMAV